MVVGVQVVDCSEASNKECRHAQHAANAFDTEKVALMHGIFQMLQGKPLHWCIPPLSGFGMTCLDLSCILVCVLMKHVTFLTQGLSVVTAGLSVGNDCETCCAR